MASSRSTIPDNLSIAAAAASTLDSFHPLSGLRRRLEGGAWYWHRFTSMSFPELGHRASEQFKRKVSRHRGAHFPPIVDASRAFAMLPVMSWNLPGLAREPTTLRAWRRAASDLAAGRIRLLGMNWPIVGGAWRWHVDPVSGKTWPSDIYCFDIPYRRADSYGDIKYVWELNRLQYLQAVAALAIVDRDRDLARLCAREIESWMDANPPFLGVNWSSGIEIALRIMSILIVLSLLEPAGLLVVDRDRLWRSLAAHGYWLRRFPSRFSSANNHCVAEAGGLYFLGRLAPLLPDAAKWAEFGRRTLIAEAARQIHPDGVGAEQSPSYTAFTLEWLLLCGELGKRLGEPFPESYWQRVLAAGEFLRWITDAGGQCPRIGDNDEGCVVCSQPESYVPGILAGISAAANRPDLAPPAQPPHLRQALLGKLAGNGSGPKGVRHFARGGYTVARALHGRKQSLVVLDHGPVGYLSIAAHGHADALAIWLHIDDQPVLVDAGTYLYHAGGDWRTHFRSTPAHNTLSIAGTSSSCMTGPFNWSAKAKTTVLAFNGDPDRWHVEVEHDGFVRPFAVRHRRRIERIGPDGFLVTDMLLGTGGPFDVEIGFLFHPSLEVDIEGYRVIAHHGSDALLSIDADAPLVASIERGDLEPMRAWYSGAFGHKEPTRRLVYRGRLAAGTPYRFVLQLQAQAIVTPGGEP
jgi:hypothetical protein